MAVMPDISINCDMGEGFGRWVLGPDEALMPMLDYVNVACGMHAGDPTTMVRTVRLAKAAGKPVGAHPGFNDLLGFGRRTISISEEDAFALVLYQLGALKAICDVEGVVFSHVKFHGALYFVLRDQPNILRAVLKAVKHYEVPFFGLAGTAHEELCKEFGIEFVPELFVDIDYSSEGKLLSVPESNKPTVDGIREKIAKILKDQQTLDVDGKALSLQDQLNIGGRFTICLHSDMPTALDNVRTVRDALQSA